LANEGVKNGTLSVDQLNDLMARLGDPSTPLGGVFKRGNDRMANLGSRAFGAAGSDQRITPGDISGATLGELGVLLQRAQSRDAMAQAAAAQAAAEEARAQQGLDFEGQRVQLDAERVRQAQERIGIEQQQLRIQFEELGLDRDAADREAQRLAIANEQLRIAKEQLDIAKQDAKIRMGQFGIDLSEEERAAQAFEPAQARLASEEERAQAQEVRDVAEEGRRDVRLGLDVEVGQRAQEQLDLARQRFGLEQERVDLEGRRVASDEARLGLELETAEKQDAMNRIKRAEEQVGPLTTSQKLEAFGFSPEERTELEKKMEFIEQEVRKKRGTGLTVEEFMIASGAFGSGLNVEFNSQTGDFSLSQGPRLPASKAEDIRQLASGLGRDIDLIENLLLLPEGSFGTTAALKLFASEVGEISSSLVSDFFPTRTVDALTGIGRFAEGLFRSEKKDDISPELRKELFDDPANTVAGLSGRLTYAYARTLQPSGKLLKDAVNTAREVAGTTALTTSDPRTRTNLRIILDALRDSFVTLTGEESPTTQRPGSAFETGAELTPGGRFRHIGDGKFEPIQ
jgi:hypothetical protein